MQSELNEAYFTFCAVESGEKCMWGEGGDLEREEKKERLSDSKRERECEQNVNDFILLLYCYYQLHFKTLQVS